MARRQRADQETGTNQELQDEGSDRREGSEVMDIEQANAIRRTINAAGNGEEAMRKELVAQERERKREERERLLTTVSLPIEVGDSESFLGFALLDVVNEKDGGSGPKLILSSFHRALSTKQLANLKACAGEDGSGLRTRDFENALVVAISKGILSENSLSRSPYGPHNRIQWLPGAEKETMVLLAGGHRQKTSEVLTERHIEEIDRLRKRIDRLNSRGSDGGVRDIEEKIKRVQEAMEARVVWLVMVFDKEPILEEHRRSAPALLKLITNNRLPPLPDSEEDELANVFRLSFRAGKPYPTDIMKYMKTLNSTRANAYRRLTLRGGDFLSFVIETRASTHFAHFFTDSAKIIVVQLEIWGLIGRTVRSMWEQVLYVCSDVPGLPIPDGADDVNAAYCTELVEHISSLTSETYVSTVVLDILMEVADSLFNEHFSAEFLYIGTRSEDYKDSYNGYAADVLGGFEKAMELSFKETPQNWKVEDRRVRQNALPKLRVLLLGQAAFRADGSPHFDSPFPLFSPMCGASIIDDWLCAKDSVQMVSSWFLPGITMIQNLALGRSSSLPIASYPDAITLFLKHWLGCETHPDWNTSSADEMLNKTFEDGELGSEVVKAAFDVVVRLLWRYRQSVLLPAQRLLPAMPRVKAYGSRTPSDIQDPDLFKTISEDGVAMMGRWMKYVAKETKTQQKHVTHRLHPNIPDPLLEEIAEQEQTTGRPSPFPPILEALVCSPINYLVSLTGPPNNDHHYLNTLRYVSDEVRFYENQLLPALSHVEPVLTLFTELVSVVHQHPDLHEAKFWPNIPLLSDGAREIDAGAYYKLHVRKSRESRMEVFKSALTSFAKRIGAADCLGVLIDEDSNEDDKPARAKITHKLHPALHSMFVQMLHQATLVSHHLSVIDFSPRLRQWPSVDASWFSDEDEDNPLLNIGHLFSSEAELEQLYQVKVVQQALGDDEPNDEQVEDDAFNPEYGRLSNSLTQSQKPSQIDDIESATSQKRGNTEVESPTASPLPKRMKASDGEGGSEE